MDPQHQAVTIVFLTKLDQGRRGYKAATPVSESGSFDALVADNPLGIGRRDRASSALEGGRVRAKFVSSTEAFLKALLFGLSIQQLLSNYRNLTMRING